MTYEFRNQLHEQSVLCCIFCHRELMLEFTEIPSHWCLQTLRQMDVNDVWRAAYRAAHPKKPYKKPVLKVYGDVRNMTEANLMGSKADHHMARIGHKTA